MSDQYTRVTCGGSPLDKNDPVVGLLFGEVLDGILQIKDADDIPTDRSEGSTLQVALHRAVFPQHSVVGWYRVSKDDEEDEPTSQDLQVTQELLQHYADPMIFCLLQVQNNNNNNHSFKETTKGPNNTLQELPISLYELHSNGAVFLGLQHWQLETSEPERIAVERVMREEPLQQTQKSSFLTKVQSMQNSLSNMKERIQILMEYLQNVQTGTLPSNPTLSRDVQGIVDMLGPLSALTHEVPTDQESAILLSHLAAIAKTTSTVQAYTDKFRLMHENRSIGKEMRRAF